MKTETPKVGRPPRVGRYPMNAVKQYLSKIGRKGGKSKSRAKLAAARENGKLGGRPKLNRK